MISKKLTWFSIGIMGGMLLGMCVASFDIIALAGIINYLPFWVMPALIIGVIFSMIAIWKSWKEIKEMFKWKKRRKHAQ